MLGQKLSDLESAVTAGTAPAWALRIDPEFMKVLKNLGNQAVYTNGGNISLQEGLDASLYPKVEQTFAELIDLVTGVNN